MTVRAAIGVLATLAAAGCVRVDPYRCEFDPECTSAADGRCEPDGYCSYTDATCDSGRRYGALAGPRSDDCVEDDGATASTTTTSGSSTAGDDPQASSSAGSSSGGCEGACPIPSGEARWELVFAGDAGDTDRLNALVRLPDDDVLAVGSEVITTQDALLVRVDAEGGLVARRTHDVQGGADEALAIVLDAEGDAWVCGRGDAPGDTALQAWIGSFPAMLVGDPIDSLSLDHQACRAMDIIDSGAWIAAGDDVNIGPSAWTFAFPPWNLPSGTASSVPGTADDRILASTPLGGDVLLGGAFADHGAVARVVDGTWGPPVFVHDAISRVQGLASTTDWFVVGGLEETPNQADAWITARDQDGDERWTWRPDPVSPLGDEIESVALDGSGNVIAVGFTGPQRWALSLDPDGALRWSRTWDAPALGREIVRDVGVLADGDLIVVGEIVGTDGSLDGWIARLAP